MAIAAGGGFIFIIMGSLASNTQVGLDKIVHAVGYGLLGLLCILGLPPIWYVPAFIGIVVAGIGLEYAQKAVLSGRQMEVDDVVANSIGFLTGSFLGFVIRVGWGYAQTELLLWLDRRRLVSLEDGDLLFKEGDASEDAYVVREGCLSITKSVEGSDEEIARLEVGEVVGEMGAIEGVPRSATARAVGDVLMYRISAKRILGETKEEREHPVLPIARALAKRLRESNKKN
ncbi:MAG: cyclic nucleotide-binding domain-containing protein [Verrucomicrobiota bacterium]